MKPTKEIETAFQPVQSTVEQWLNEYGYECSQERVLEPYTCDIFCDRLQIDIECDSVYHYQKRDRRRDKYVLETYGVRTFRINYNDIVEENKEKIMNKFEKWLKLKN